MGEFNEWSDAHRVAIDLANQFNHDVAIRKVRWYGKTQYVVSLASRNDSDYAAAEIVTPNTPHTVR